MTHAIRVPILLTVGEHDSLDCNAALGLSCATPTAVLAREAAHYSPEACLSAFVVPDAGHATNLHRSARSAYDHMNVWLDRYTVNSGRATAGCLA